MPQPLPQSQPSASRYILTALAIILVITTFILVGLNALNLQNRFGATTTGSMTTATQGYRDGYLAARVRYEPMCPFANQKTSIVSGLVTAIAATSFTITQNSLDTDSIVDGIGDSRTIALTAQTQILKLTPKNSDQLAMEQTKFIETSKTQKDAVPPSPVVQQNLSLADLKIGQTVYVQSTMPDVRLEQTIYAQTVTVKN